MAVQRLKERGHAIFATGAQPCCFAGNIGSRRHGGENGNHRLEPPLMFCASEAGRLLPRLLCLQLMHTLASTDRRVER
jgi:hypothetical protein